MGDLDEIASDDATPAEEPDDLDQLGHGDAARLGRAGARRLRGIEDVDVDGDVERIAGQVWERAPHRFHRVDLEGGKEARASARVLLAGAGADADLVNALGRHDVHDPGHGRGVVVALTQEFLAQVGMGVELEHAEPREVRGQRLDDGYRRRVVAAEHERQESRAPPAVDLRAGGVELLAGRRAVGQLAVPEVGEGQILQVEPERGGVRLDGVRGQPEVARAAVGALAEVHAALEGNSVERDGGLGEGPVAGDERGCCRSHGAPPRRRPPRRDPPRRGGRWRRGRSRCAPPDARWRRSAARGSPRRASGRPRRAWRRWRARPRPAWPRRGIP